MLRRPEALLKYLGSFLGAFGRPKWASPRWVPLLPGPTKGQEGPGRLPGTDFGGFRGCILNDFVDFQFGFCYISKDFGGNFHRGVGKG